jgi:hypothetical protein
MKTGTNILTVPPIKNREHQRATSGEGCRAKLRSAGFGEVAGVQELQNKKEIVPPALTF